MAECGTRASYLHGCRCDPCTTANTQYMTDWRRSRRGGQVIASSRTTRQRAIDDYGTWTRERYPEDVRGA